MEAGFCWGGKRTNQEYRGEMGQGTLPDKWGMRTRRVGPVRKGITFTVGKFVDPQACWLTWLFSTTTTKAIQPQQN